VLFQAEDYELVASNEVVFARWFPLTRLVEPEAVLAEGRRTDESVARVARRALSSDGLLRSACRGGDG
jgi:hypothetical protein